MRTPDEVTIAIRTKDFKDQHAARRDAARILSQLHRLETVEVTDARTAQRSHWFLLDGAVVLVSSRVWRAKFRARGPTLLRLARRASRRHRWEAQLGTRVEAMPQTQEPASLPAHPLQGSSRSAPPIGLTEMRPFGSSAQGGEDGF